MQKSGLGDNHSTLGYRLMREIQDGIKNGTLLGRRIRETSLALRKLIQMANCTTGDRVALAKEYLAHVQTNGLQSREVISNSGIEVFTNTLAVFLHDPSEIEDMAWEVRDNYTTNSEGRSSQLFKTWKEQELHERKCRSHYGGAPNQYFATED